MALITCPDCSREVSDRAPTCPGCGAPIATSRDVDSVGTPLTTTQLTSKHLKAHALFGILLILVGLGFAWVAPPDTHPAWVIVTGLLIPIGFIWWLTARIMTWWHHR
jgi:hypothetical protein